MAHEQAEIVVNASADATWKIVRHFHGLHEWMPGVDDLVSEGDDRVLSMMGMSVRERLVALDDDGRALTYAIVDGVPVESHEATIAVIEEGDSCRVVWSVTATPDEMAGLMQGIYQQALTPLKEKAEGAA
jgi:carbon monoxide dehydrogenase subunit G